MNKKFFRRKNGYLPKIWGGGLVLYPTFSVDSSKDRIVLNHSATALWQLSSGLLDQTEILEELSLHNQGPETPTEASVNEGLQQLVTQEIVEALDAPFEAAPYLKIGFANFWPDFDIEQNYFLDAIATHFTAYTVDPRKETPDLLFYSEHPSKDFDHSFVNRQETLKIGFFTKPEHVDPNQYDLALLSFPKEETERTISIPLWSILFNWKKEKAQLAVLPEQFDPVFQDPSPISIGNKILEFLNSDLLPDDLDLPSAPYQQEEAPKNIGKISDFSKIKKGALTIGMATYDDFDGVYFTIQSIRLHHKEILDRLSFIVIDNNPDTAVSEALQKFGESISNFRYIPFSEFNSTAVRDIFFREADTEYVMSIDSHILIESGAIQSLLNYLDKHPKSMDLIQGPLLYDGLKGNYSTGFFPQWQKGMYGYWNTDPRGAEPQNEPFEITMQGLGLFACRKEAWPGFNPRFRGFGGEEGYIQEKFRQNGFRTLCLPALRWVHRFYRPTGTKYKMNWGDRIYNYHVGWREIGWDTSSIDIHFKALLKADAFEKEIETVQRDLNNPLFYFDAVYYIFKPTQDTPQSTFINSLNLSRIIRFYQVEGSAKINYEKVRADIIDQAVRYGLEHVLIIDERAEPERNFLKFMTQVTQKMKSSDWKSWYLGKDKMGKIKAEFFNKTYIAQKDRPMNSFICAFSLNHFYEMASLLKQENSKNNKLSALEISK